MTGDQFALPADGLMSRGARPHLAISRRTVVGMTDTGTQFAHSTPELYDRSMGPLLFESDAKVMADRAALLRSDVVLMSAQPQDELSAATPGARPCPASRSARD